MLSEKIVRELNALFAEELSLINQDWEIPLSEMRIGEYWIIPLTSNKMLRSESFWMKNCCRDYALSCRDGNYYIFSIRDYQNQRVATLGLAHTSGYWSVNQCLGPNNTNVIEEETEKLDDGVNIVEYSISDIYYVAFEVARLMNLRHCS